MEEIILVDRKDRVIGKSSKDDCHRGSGKRHRAFSVLVIDNMGRLLLQKRSSFKKLWSRFWTNTCCSHFIKEGGEKEWAEKRLFEEMGFSCPLRFLFKLGYEAEFKDFGSEREITHVFWGKFNGRVVPDKREVADYKWVKMEDLGKEIKKNPEIFTPWFKKIMARIFSSKKWQKMLLETRITDNLEEIFDVVNLEDKVFGQATRRECHFDRSLIHRGVAAIAVNKKGQIFLQKRSKTKDLYPGFWSSSASGHVSAGQDYKEIARREIKEELGIDVKKKEIKFLTKFLMKRPEETEMNVIFSFFHEGPFKLSSEEIRKGEWFDINEFIKKARRKKISLTPCTEEIFLKNTNNVLGVLQKWIRK